MNIVSPTTLLLPETKSGPNNPTLPVVIYRGVFDRQVAEKDKLFQQCFGQSGWKGVWKNGIYDYHHFHPSSHEVLGIAKGSVHLMLGGEDGEELIAQTAVPKTDPLYGEKGPLPGAWS